MEGELEEMGTALVATLIADVALYRLLRRLEIRPDALLGHGSGEYSALIASGCFGANDLLLEHLVELSSIRERLRAQEERPGVASATQQVEQCLAGMLCSPPDIEVYSPTTMSPYPREPREIRALLADHWSRPVEFRGTVVALYEAGARIFVEVGPGDTLTTVVGDILQGRPHLAIPCDMPRRAGITQFHHVVGVLATHQVRMHLDHLYEIRGCRRLPLDNPASVAGAATHGAVMSLSLDLPTLRFSPDRVVSLVGCRSSAKNTGNPGPADEAEPQTADPEPTPRSELDPEGMERGGLASAAVFEPTRGSPGSIAQVMREHLRTMDRFLTVQREMMEAFLGGEGASPAREPDQAPPEAPRSSFPFIGTVTSFTPEREIVIRRRIDPEEDIFLPDHAFGFEVSDVDEALKPLPVMPLTMSIEIMAEAAAAVMPGRVLTGMRQVLARQWITVGAPITLEISARRGTSGEEVEVKIRNLGGASEVGSPAGDPVTEATAIFAEAYPPPPPIGPVVLTSARPCRHTAAQMYEERLMFHGPRFQKVASLDKSGDNGIVGQLQVSPPADLFRFDPRPDLLIDPILLDAAGQLLGYWAVERLESGYIVLPVQVVALDIFGPSRWDPERVRCEVEVQQVTSRQLRATINLFGSDGDLRLRVEGWEDIRSFWPREFYDFFRFPKQHLLTKAWDIPISSLPSRDAFACQRLETTWESTRSIVGQALGHTILSRGEREEYAGLRGPEARRAEWLFGRACAKDAVRRLLKQRDGMDVCPADIEIAHDPGGQPFARAPGLGESAIVPGISIAHSDGLAVAIAGYCTEAQWLGVDLERIRPLQKAFQEITYTEGELALLNSLPAESRDEWVTRLWCAKEAVTKAVGRGLAEGPRSVTIQRLDAATGRVAVILEERLAREFPELGGVPLVVYTARDEDWVVASTVCERGEIPAGEALRA
jgi:phosphopantetheine--protein transferase-like protein